VFTDWVQQEICFEDCNQECSERCTGTFNNYIVPLDIYREGLEILDCYFGDLSGTPESSCASGQAFWESTGYTCEVTQGNNFDCECNDPGNCLSEVYDCDFQESCALAANDSSFSDPLCPPKKTTGKGKGKGKGKGSSSSRKYDKLRRKVRF